MENFETLFKKERGKRNLKSSSHDANQQNLSRPMRLLEGQRSQAIGILLRSLHVDLDEITQAVITMETGLVDIDSLKALNEMVSCDWFEVVPA